MKLHKESYENSVERREVELAELEYHSEFCSKCGDAINVIPANVCCVCKKAFCSKCFRVHKLEHVFGMGYSEIKERIADCFVHAHCQPYMDEIGAQKAQALSLLYIIKKLDERTLEGERSK